MPKHSLTLPDIEQSVSRPIIYTVLDQLFDIMGLSKDTRILYAGKNGTLGTPGTTIDAPSRDAVFANGRYTFVEVDETYQTGALQETHIYDDEHVPIFLDPALGVGLYPIYTTSDVVIQIRYRANSETEARRWYSGMQTRASAGRDINVHRVMYKFPIPFTFVTMLEEIWKLREAVDGYGEDFRDYVVKNSSDRLTLLANRAGKYQLLGIKERQARVQGLFDFSGLPDVPVRDSSTGSWEIAFTYKFSYQRPDEVRMDYPIAIHNQLVPEKFVEESVIDDGSEGHEGYYSKSYEALSIFEGARISESLRPHPSFIRIPDFDEFKIPNPPNGTATIFTALCFLDDDKKLLLNMNELGDLFIDPDIMEFLVSEVSWMTRPYQSVLQINTYLNNNPVDSSKIEMNSATDVLSKEPLSLRACHRVRFSIVIDYKLLPWEALERLGKFPKAAVKIMGSINELLRWNPDFGKLENVEKLQPWHLTYLYWVMTGGHNAPKSSYIWNDAMAANFKGKAGDRFIGTISSDDLFNFYRNNNRQMRTVQYSCIIAQRQE